MSSSLQASASSSSLRPRPPMPSPLPQPPQSSPQTAVAAAKPQQSNLLQYFIAGGAAGAASRTVVSPLERLKIIYQCQGAGAANYQGLIPSLIKIGKEEGWKGYFRGNGINVVRIAPYSAIQFTSYEVTKKLLARLSGSSPADLTTPLRLSAGAIAGICSVMSTYPLDLVRSRLSIVSASIGSRVPVVDGKEMGIWGMGVKVFKEEGGIRGLYRGLVPTAVGVAPYVGSNFAFYEFLKKYFTPPDRPTTALRKLGCGALAGACSQTITYPLDVLRRRMQVTGMKDLGLDNYNGAIHATRIIVGKEGIKGLYKGLLPNLLKVAPSIGTSFVVYEFIRDQLLELDV